MTFESTLTQFLDELKGTFPEFSSELDGEKRRSPEEKRSRFLSLWRVHTSDVAMQNSSIFDKGYDIVPSVTITKKLWSEISKATQTAIWKYISSLLLLAAAESKEGWDLSGFQFDLEEILKKLKEGGLGAGMEGLGNMKDIFEKLTHMASEFGFKDFGTMKDNFKLPERMFKGHIAKIVQELVEEFKPEDFGITADMVEHGDPARMFEILQDVFTKNPEMLATAAQKIAKKLQAKFQKGEIKREDIIQEAEELMKEFSENEMFSSLFESIGEMMKQSEKSSGNEGSARRREVQERLRKKKAEKDAKATNLVVHTGGRTAADADAAADAVACALLEEESRNKSMDKSMDKSKSKKPDTKSKKK
jgi:hypothetical protein